MGFVSRFCDNSENWGPIIAGVAELFSYVQFINYSMCLQVSLVGEVWLARRCIIQAEHNAISTCVPQDIKLLKDYAYLYIRWGSTKEYRSVIPSLAWLKTCGKSPRFMRHISVLLESYHNFHSNVNLKWCREHFCSKEILRTALKSARESCLLFTKVSVFPCSETEIFWSVC